MPETARDTPPTASFLYAEPHRTNAEKKAFIDWYVAETGFPNSTQKIREHLEKVFGDALKKALCQSSTLLTTITVLSEKVATVQYPDLM